VYTAENGLLHGPYTAVYTGRLHGPYTAVYIFVYTGRIHSRVHTACRVYGTYTTVYTGRHGLYTIRTRPVQGGVTAVYTRIGVHELCSTRLLHGHVLALSTAENAAYTARRVNGTYTAVYTFRHGPLRACTGPTRPVHGRVHGPFTAV